MSEHLNESQSVAVTLTVSAWADVAAALTHAYGPQHPAIESIRRAVTAPSVGPRGSGQEGRD